MRGFHYLENASIASSNSVINSIIEYYGYGLQYLPRRNYNKKNPNLKLTIKISKKGRNKKTIIERVDSAIVDGQITIVDWFLLLGLIYKIYQGRPNPTPTVLL